MLTRNEFLRRLAEALDVAELSEGQDLPPIDSLAVLNLIDLYDMEGVAVDAATLYEVRSVGQLLELAGRAING